MKKKVIDSMLWNISGASEKSNGKYLIRYRSEESMGNKNASLIHEHVFQKKYLIDEIIEKNILTKEIIEKIVGCVVTDKEHKELHKKKYNNLIGWERYEKANIKVIDKLNNQPFIFPKN